MSELYQTAICINDKTQRDKRIKVLGITEGKEYQIKPSKYANYYELVNDLGNVETYFMDRFKVLENKLIFEGFDINFYKNGDVQIIMDKKENKKTWMQQAMEKVEPKVKEQLQEAINNYFEGDKMEDKTIKVRCKTNEFDFIKGKIYIAERTITGAYKLINSKGIDHLLFAVDFFTLFEKVEDALMVECIGNKCKDSQLRLTIGNKYKLEQEFEDRYYVRNDNGDVCGYKKEYFKPVEPQKEVKELDFRKVIEEIKTNEEYVCQDNFFVRCHDNGRIEFIAPSGNKIWFDKEDKFIKVEEPKPVTTAEAFKALDEGKIIESNKGYRYKKIEGIIMVETDITKAQGRGFVKFSYIGSDELQGQWIIHE